MNFNSEMEADFKTAAREEVNKEINKSEKLVADVIECVETRFDLVAIEVQDKLSDILASVASIVVISIFIGLSFIMLTVGLGLYISYRHQDSYTGFFYVAGIYLALAIVIFLGRTWLIKLPIINGLLKKINFHEED